MVSIPDFPQKGKKNRFFLPVGAAGEAEPTHQVPLSRGLGASGSGPRAAPLPRPSLPRLPYSECFWSGAACLGTLAAGCHCSESPAVSGPRPSTLAVGRRALAALPLFEADG